MSRASAEREREYCRDPISCDWALRIWQILGEECRNRDDPWERDYSFVRYLAEDKLGFGHEYRFQGALGFGGKFYNDYFSWRVDYYPENETPERIEMRKHANERLAALRVEWLAQRDTSGG